MKVSSFTLRQRYQDLEIGATRHAVAFDQTMVLLHKGLGQRQTQTRATFTP